MSERSPAGTTRLPNGAIQYDCCENTGGTPEIVHVANDDRELVAEEYYCPHCDAYQGEREIVREEKDVEPYARAFNQVGDA